MPIELRNSDRLAPSQGFAHASIAPAGRLVHLAGQIGTDASGTLADGLAAQTEQALANLVDALAAADAAPANLVKTTIYVVQWTEAMQADLFAGIVAASQKVPLPEVPVTLIGVHSLFRDAALVEVEGVAVLETSPPPA
ncbi:MAG: RidA family protein [Actinomycetota bacterium]